MDRLGEASALAGATLLFQESINLIYGEANNFCFMGVRCGNRPSIV